MKPQFRAPLLSRATVALPAIARGLVVLALGAPMLSGCRPSSEGTVPTGPIVENATTGAPPPALLDRIENAPMIVSYGGKRHVLVNYTIAGVPVVLEYDEQVWSDGQGQFSIVPGDVITPHMSVQELDLFQTLQAARDGFFYRYRDFRIRDLQLLQQNWRVIDTGIQATVAGVLTSVLDFRRIAGGATWYRAWIDPQTALVMRFEERESDGQLVSRVEFVDFQMSPDTTGLGLEGDRFVRTPIDLGKDTTTDLGFKVRPPGILPKGFRLERAESTNDGTDTWAILNYTDGVDSIFFLQTFDAAGQGGQLPPGEFDVGPKVIRGFHVGPWTVLQVRFHGDLMAILGKADPASLERMLKSSIH